MNSNDDRYAAKRAAAIIWLGQDYLLAVRQKHRPAPAEQKAAEEFFKVEFTALTPEEVAGFEASLKRVAPPKLRIVK